MDVDQGLFKSLTQQSIKTVEASGLPYFHFTEKEQAGLSFGERFIHAIQQVFDQGYCNVIAIGNDSPHLGKHHILEAAAQLSRKKVVLGPSLDGGFYLFGIPQADFDAQQLKVLPWQTTSLYQSTKAYFESKHCQMVALERLSDIDTVTDIERFSGYIRSLGRFWIALFSKILQRHDQVFHVTEKSPEIHSRQIPFNKGSPICFA